MNPNDFKILKFISDNEGQVKIQLIALKNNISANYAYLVCRSLERAGYINLIRSNLCHLAPPGTDFIKKDFEKVESINTKDSKPSDIDNGELISNLTKAGYKTIADLASAPLIKLTQNFNIGVKKTAELINKARERLKNDGNAHESINGTSK